MTAICDAGKDEIAGSEISSVDTIGKVKNISYSILTTGNWKNDYVAPCLVCPLISTNSHIRC